MADLGYSGFLWHSHAVGWGSLDGVDFATSRPSSNGSTPIAGGRVDSLDDWNFLLAFSVFRLASISRGVHARALAGQTPTAQVGENGCPMLAEQALALLHR